MKSPLLKLSPGYFVLWFVLLLVIGSKMFFLRGLEPEHLVELGLFGAAMLAVAYAGASVIWFLTGKDQRTGEISYLAIITLFFIGRTVMLYREGFASL